MAAETVTVACKSPSGYMLDLMGPEESEMVPSNSGPVKQVRRALIQRVFVRGCAAERRLERGDDSGRVMEHEGISLVKGGFGLTHGVPKDFWDKWVEQNLEWPPYKNGLIFAETKGDSAGAKAIERAELRGGFEPIDPAKPGRVGGVRLEPDERHLKAA